MTDNAREPEDSAGLRRVPAMPVLSTGNLRLRAFEPSDIAALVELAGDRRIADTTLRIPHPYSAADATALLERVSRDWQAQKELTLAVADVRNDDLIGCCGLKLNFEHDSGELGYWIGVPHWGRGYATEAARAMVDHGFDHLGLHRIEAFCMLSNPASARILEKVGMRREGVQRDGIKKKGVFDDVGLYAMLSRDPRP